MGPAVDWSSLGYVVVDELHEGVAGLVVSRWPQVDERGRLHFGEESDTSRIATLAQALLALLRDERKPIVPGDVDEDQERALRDRDLQIGDVFAARLKQMPGEGPGGDGPGGPGGDGPGGGGTEAADAAEDPGAWLAAPILDITAEALDVTKAQASAAVSGVIDERYLDLIADEMNEDEGGPADTTPTPAAPLPTGSSSGSEMAGV